MWSIMYWHISEHNLEVGENDVPNIFLINQTTLAAKAAE